MKKSRVTIAYVFKTIIWPRKNLILLGLVLIIISRVAGLVPPAATKPFADDVLVNKDLSKLPEILVWVTRDYYIPPDQFASFEEENPNVSVTVEG